MNASIESELNQQLRERSCSTKHAEILFLLLYRLKFVVMYQSLRKLSFILITLMVTAGCSSFQTVAKKKRDLSTSSYYTVKKGDNLSTVGFRSGNGYKQLARWNKIPPPYRIYPGQKLKLFSEARSKKSSIGQRQQRQANSQLLQLLLIITQCYKISVLRFQY